MVKVLQRLQQESEADRALAIHCVEFDKVRVDHVHGVDLRGARDGVDQRGVVAQPEALAVVAVVARWWLGDFGRVRLQKEKTSIRSGASERASEHLAEPMDCHFAGGG